MIHRLKQAPVESYVGAIGLSYLLAQIVLHFVNTFVSPTAVWISRKQYGDLMQHNAVSTGFSLQDGLPELVRFFLVPLAAFVLLYFKLLMKKASRPVPNPEQALNDE